MNPSSRKSYVCWETWPYLLTAKFNFSYISNKWRRVTKCLSCSCESLGVLPCSFVHVFKWGGGVWRGGGRLSRTWGHILLKQQLCCQCYMVNKHVWAYKSSWIWTRTVYTVVQLTDLLLSNPLQLLCQAPYPPDLWWKQHLWFPKPRKATKCNSERQTGAFRNNDNNRHTLTHTLTPPYIH